MLVDLMKEYGFTLEKARSQQYPTQILTVADYADDIALLVNTPAQAEFLLHSLEPAASRQYRPPCQCRKKQSTCALIKIIQETSPP